MMMIKMKDDADDNTDTDDVSNGWQWDEEGNNDEDGKGYVDGYDNEDAVDGNYDGDKCGGDEDDH